MEAIRPVRPVLAVVVGAAMLLGLGTAATAALAPGTAPIPAPTPSASAKPSAKASAKPSAKASVRPSVTVAPTVTPTTVAAHDVLLRFTEATPDQVQAAAPVTYAVSAVNHGAHAEALALRIKPGRAVLEPVTQDGTFAEGEARWELTVGPGETATRELSGRYAAPPEGTTEVITSVCAFTAAGLTVITCTAKRQTLVVATVPLSNRIKPVAGVGLAVFGALVALWLVLHLRRRQRRRATGDAPPPAADGAVDELAAGALVAAGASRTPGVTGSTRDASADDVGPGHAPTSASTWGDDEGRTPPWRDGSPGPPGPARPVSPAAPMPDWLVASAVDQPPSTSTSTSTSTDGRPAPLGDDWV